jgi:hypothetical protein
MQFLIMKKIFLLLFIFFVVANSTCSAQLNLASRLKLEKDFKSPPESAAPWVFWYWYHASVSKEGITADLEAMKQAGIAGAYLMTIKGADTSYMQPPVQQLTPEWWSMVTYAFTEAKRLRIKLAMHVSDGFALAGGPWITPAMSMQKIVWTERQIEGEKLIDDTLPAPEINENYYRDIAVFAYPSPVGKTIATRTEVPFVTTSIPGKDPKFLTDPDNTKSFSSADSCWIQYAFAKPFTCRSIIIHSKTNYQSNRLIIETSDNGKNFKFLERLVPPRQGWQDSRVPYTHAIPATTARFFRFVFSKKGSEPGAEDLDAAKWKPVLKITAIELSSEPKIDEYEGKNGEVWRISKRTTEQQVPDKVCIPLKQIVDVTKFMDSTGRLRWKAPAGNWTIIRIGHTSTGQENETGGGGKGLECDKFNPVAIKVQFDNWFGEVFKKVRVAPEVLKIFHVDSWECGSQNWSPVFREEFKKRRGYDLYSYLPVMAGIPVESADVSERFLHDIRETITELLHDNFYITLANLAHEKSCAFTAESVAPTMVGDGMLHYSAVDIPMGEFWLRSPTHDKPNDMLDAISAAHIYGKPIIQAEAFTELRVMWDEFPGMLKTLQDRNYALGINKLVYHVFMHNPSLDHKPGMTLDGIGLFFQRDQTWWKPGKAWVDYARRCQFLLQIGKPVADIAVFTGEEIPRRSVLPDRLVTVLPGIFGKSVVDREEKRLANVGQPIEESPPGVFHSANIINPRNWVNSLRGYAYDSYNKDALLHFSKVDNGEIELNGGAKYKLLVIPGDRRMSPNSGWMSVEVARKLKEMVDHGATLLVSKKPHNSIGLLNQKRTEVELNAILNSIWNHKQTNKASGFTSWKVGKGTVVQTPFKANSFDGLGIEKDFIATDLSGRPADGIAWTHRTAPGLDIYFISNQQNKERIVDLSLRVEGREPELWDAVTGETMTANAWQFKKGRTLLPVKLSPNGSIFVIMDKPTKMQFSRKGKNWTKMIIVQKIEGPWIVSFDSKLGGPTKPVIFKTLMDWSKQKDTSIRYYSGTATYVKTFTWDSTKSKNGRIWLNIGKVADIAQVIINGTDCGIAWTNPFRIDITKALRDGENELTIKVTNTWRNRLIGDHRLPEEKRATHTNAPYRLNDEPLLKAGLTGPVDIEISQN